MEDKSNNKSAVRVEHMGPLQRSLRAFGPLGAGYLLDAVDLLTFGPLGFYLGPLLGGLLGLWIASVYGLGWLGQTAVVLLAAIYCMLPMTEFMPLATIGFALLRFAETRRVVELPDETQDDSQD